MQLTTHNLRANLEQYHPGGHQELLDIAATHSRDAAHDGIHPTSREDTSGGPLSLPFKVVPPAVLLDAAPWLEGWYCGTLLEKAREFAGPLVAASQSVINYPLLNIHVPGHGYEAHVDTNKPTGLYYLGEADRTEATGGALCLSRRGDVPVAELLEDCDSYYPRVGEYAVMNGYGVTHAVTPSTDGLPRIMLVCNFWTPDTPEIARGAGLAAYQEGSSQ